MLDKDYLIQFYFGPMMFREELLSTAANILQLPVETEDQRKDCIRRTVLGALKAIFEVPEYAEALQEAKPFFDALDSQTGAEAPIEVPVVREGSVYKVDLAFLDEPPKVLVS